MYAVVCSVLGVVCLALGFAFRSGFKVRYYVAVLCVYGCCWAILIVCGLIVGRVFGMFKLLYCVVGLGFMSCIVFCRLGVRFGLWVGFWGDLVSSRVIVWIWFELCVSL